MSDPQPGEDQPQQSLSQQSPSSPGHHPQQEAQQLTSAPESSPAKTVSLADRAAVSGALLLAGAGHELEAAPVSHDDTPADVNSDANYNEPVPGEDGNTIDNDHSGVQQADAGQVADEHPDTSVVPHTNYDHGNEQADASEGAAQEHLADANQGEAHDRHTDHETAEHERAVEVHDHQNAEAQSGQTEQDQHMVDGDVKQHFTNANVASPIAAPTQEGVVQSSEPSNQAPGSTGVPAVPLPPRAGKGGERYHASVEQLKHLVAAFAQNPCPSVATLNYLSSTIGMPMHNLVLWFKNRRARSRKDYRIPGQRRSYVKSGIYSRVRKSNAVHTNAPAMPHEMQQDMTMRPGPENYPMQASQEPTPSNYNTVPYIEEGNHPPVGTAQVAGATGRDADVNADIGESRALDVTGKRKAKDVTEASEEYKEARRRVLESSPIETRRPGMKESWCRHWTSEYCLQVCMAFFNKHIGSRHPDQAQAANAVAAEFFINEMQCGVTLTSTVQSLDDILRIMDTALARVRENGLPTLSSGSTTVLREFVLQIRNGDAAEFVDGNMDLFEKPN